MPELPEVEAARRAAQKVAAGRRIVSAYVADDPIVFEGVSPARFRRALVGRRDVDGGFDRPAIGGASVERSQAQPAGDFAAVGLGHPDRPRGRVVGAEPLFP